MATSPTPPGGNGAKHDDFTDSDALWFDRLAGRSTGQATHASQHEADLLRAALEMETDPEWRARTSAEAAEQHWQSLERQLAAAREPRAVAPGATAPVAPSPPPARAAPRQSTPPNTWQRWRDALLGGGTAAAPARWGAVAALAGVAALAVALWQQAGPGRDIGGEGLPPGSVLMGGTGDARVQAVDTRTPRRDAEAFVAALRAAAALQPGLYSDPDGVAGVVIVDVEIEGDQLAAAAAVFERRQLKAPPGVGLARVVFSRR